MVFLVIRFGFCRIFEFEYEVEFVYKEEENMYEIPLISGHYMVVLKYPGIEQISEHIVISPLETGNTILNYWLEIAQKKQIFVTVKDSDLINLQGVLVWMAIKNDRNF